MIKKFDSHEEAIAAGFPNPMGNGEYGQGGEKLSREHYAKLFEAVGPLGPLDTVQPFILPDFRLPERKP
jgi:hypothetical protein